MKSLVLVFLALLVTFAVGNRYTSARVPVGSARGPSAVPQDAYICFQDEEYGHDICFHEGPAPRFLPEETVYGAQTFLGHISPHGVRDQIIGYVYGHSLEGKVSTYLVAGVGEDLYVYSFDYCPRVWREEPDAKFSVYHVIKGSQNLPSMETFTKPPFEQRNNIQELGQPGGQQVFCSTERFGPSTIPPPPQEDVEPIQLKNPRKYSRAPSFDDTGDVLDGFCFYDPAYPQKRWYIVGGSGQYLSGEGRQIHQYYHGTVEDYDLGTSEMAYGHAPRGQKWLMLSSKIEGRGYVTYIIAFEPNTVSDIQGSYMWEGSSDEESLNKNLQRVEVLHC